MNSLRSTRPKRLSAALTLVALLASACSDGPTGPPLGNLRVSVETSGGDLDIDGYEIVVDSGMRHYINPIGAFVAPDGTRAELTIPRISDGAHSVSLQSVADNCTVSETNPRSVTIAAGGAASVAFTVMCVATGIEITTHTTGADSPFAYDLRVDQASYPVVTNGTQVVSRLQPGAHVISLRLPPPNCSVVGGDQTVTVATGSITPVRFEVSCLPIVRLEKIAYVVDTVVAGKPTRMVALVKPDGSGAAALAVGDSPSWSPFGAKLVLTEAVCDYYDPYYGIDCNGGLVIVDPETGNRALVDGGSAAFGPAWSPSGDAIAFTRCCAYADRNRLYVVRGDASQPSQLAIAQVLQVSSPGWSPDGKRIAFICSSGPTTDLCVIDKSGDGFTRFVGGDVSVGQGRPAWRPDGTSIAFTGFPLGSTRPQITLLDLNSGAITRVTDGSEPAWSPDGSRLVFAGATTRGLFTVNVDGSSVSQLTLGAYSAPAWRP